MKNLYLLLFLLAATAAQLHAQATLSIQGVVKKSNGSAVDDDTYSLTFKLYESESGGTAVWSETQDLLVEGGIYSALLGSVNPLTPAFDVTYYLGVAVDGGAELTPRARLTSSPYALSLIGQDNKFPSTGAVEVGGSSTAELKFKQGANEASITYDGTNINVENLNLSSFSPANLAVTSKLAVGQSSVDPNNALKVTGNSEIAGHLLITGSKIYNYAGWVRSASSGTTIYYGNQGNYGFALQASGRVVSEEFWCVSDRRIKKDFHLSENFADLATLRKLRVTDYRHIDEVSKGSDLKKGFIAQEIKTVFPEAVTTSADFIPNVYALSTSTGLSGGRMSISLEKNHDFTVGDEVKLMTETSEKKLTVAAVPAPNSFVVDWDGAVQDKIFVFGKKVNNFLTVDYDRIFTLNVSATQELARQVEQLKQENAELRRQNEAMRSDFESRLSKLENSTSGTAQK